MRHIYTFFLYLLIPFIILRLIWKSRRLPAYRHRILERFSFGSKIAAPVDVWLHAVSMGEVVAATPLIDRLLSKNWRVLVTTMTPTGSAQVSKRFGAKVLHQYVPYDLPWALRRFFKKYTPRLGVILETELWPNLINQGKLAEMPLILANARLSDRAFKQYEKVDFLFKPILNQFSAIYAQSEEDSNRFIKLGAEHHVVQKLGNMKFDMSLHCAPKKECAELKEQWGKQRTVLIAASTHDDEERQLLSKRSALAEAIPGLLLLFAPRHPERFQAVFQMSVAQGFKTGLRSCPETIDHTTQVVVVDSMGELLNFYQLSDYAFVGGSLVPIGGHNVLEPIAVNVPVFCGPFMQNSRAICQDLQRAKAIVLVDHVDELVAALINMHNHRLQREQQVANASTVLVANQGTIARYMERVEFFLNERVRAVEP